MSMNADPSSSADHKKWGLTNHSLLTCQHTRPPSVSTLPKIPPHPAMSKELGTLVVVVLKAKNLHDRHSFYKQDPYAKVTLNGKTVKTSTDVKGGQHPEWDSEFRFPVYAAKSDSARQLEVACWRAEPREDEEIGKGKVDISDTLRTGEFDGEFQRPTPRSWSQIWLRRLTACIFTSSHNADFRS